MDMRLKNTKLALVKDGLLTFRGGQNARITCLSGSLWITQECQVKDVVLEPGNSLAMGHEGLTVITALTPSTLLVHEERPAHVRGARHASLRQVLQRWLGSPAGQPS
jgi:hypothetical protein